MKLPTYTIFPNPDTLANTWLANYPWLANNTWVAFRRSRDSFGSGESGRRLWLDSAGIVEISNGVVQFVDGEHLTAWLLKWS